MSRGLGGELSVEPFVSAGIALGPFDVLASISYEWIVNGPTPREQALTWNIALGYPASRWFTPFVELNSVTQTAGARPEDGPDLIGKVQMYLTPGFNVSPIPGMTFRAGVQLPLARARASSATRSTPVSSGSSSQSDDKGPSASSRRRGPRRRPP